MKNSVAVPKTSLPGSSTLRAALRKYSPPPMRPSGPSTHDSASLIDMNLGRSAEHSSSQAALESAWAADMDLSSSAKSSIGAVPLAGLMDKQKANVGAHHNAIKP